MQLSWLCTKGIASLVPLRGFPGPEMDLGAPRGSESHPTFSANTLGKVLSAQGIKGQTFSLTTSNDLRMLQCLA